MKVKTSMYPYAVGLLTAFAVILFMEIRARAAITDHWYWRNPNPAANTFRSICFGAGKFVAVGDGGVIHTSFDGVNWDDGRRPTTSIWRKVIYANGRFLAAGHDGAIATSIDGYSWTLRSSGTTNMLFSIATEGGRYLACGQAGQVTISTNGLDWTAGYVGTNDLGWVAAGNGLFILPMPNREMAIRISNDMQTWTPVTLPNAGGIVWPHYLFEVQFGNGLFVAAVSDEVYGDPGWYPGVHLYHSPDGVGWEQGVLAGGSDSYRFLNYVNGVFSVFTTGGSSHLLFNSPDGAVSTYSLLPLPMSEANCMGYGNGTYVMPGAAGKVWTSGDTTNWNANYSGLRTNFYQLVRGASNYVLIAAGQRILVSPDGVGFAPATNSPLGVLSSASFDGSNFVAVGKIAQGGLLNYVGEVYTSTNSTDWVRRTSNADKPLTSACRGATRWIAVGESGRVITSPTGLAWTLRPSGTGNHLKGIAFGNGLYVAVGNSGTIITSPDGAAWDAQFSGTVANLNSVRFLNGQFVTVGANGTILTSSDGATWSSQASGTTRTLTDAAFGDGYYVVCGADILLSTTANVLLRSTNAVNWEEATTQLPAQGALNSIAFLEDSFWLCGASGALLQSDSIGGIPQLAGAALSGNNGFQIRVTMNAPLSYRLQASPDLTADSWTNIAIITNSTRQPVFVDRDTLASPKKYYRLVSP